VVCVDLASITEAFDDAFDRHADTGHMPAGGFASGENFAVGAIEGRGIVLHLGGVDCAAYSFQSDAGFLGDLVQPMGENFEGNGVGGSLFGAAWRLAFVYPPAVMMMFRSASTAARLRGFTTTVVTGVSTIAGPEISPPGFSRSKSYTAVGTNLP